MLGCCCRNVAATSWSTSPSTARRTISALCSPVARISDLARLEDRRHAHRDRFAGDVLLAEEIGRGVPPGHQVERDQPRPALGARAGLVEADVPGPADAEQLEVDASGGLDRRLVAAALVLDI